MPGLMSGDWKRGTVSGPQRLQLYAWTAPDLLTTAPALDSDPVPRKRLRKPLPGFIVVPADHNSRQPWAGKESMHAGHVRYRRLSSPCARRCRFERCRIGLGRLQRAGGQSNGCAGSAANSRASRQANHGAGGSANDCPDGGREAGGCTDNGTGADRRTRCRGRRQHTDRANHQDRDQSLLRQDARKCAGAGESTQRSGRSARRQVRRRQRRPDHCHPEPGR